MKNIFTLLLLLSFSILLSEEITIESYVSGFKYDYRVEGKKEIVKALEKKDEDTPFLNEVEFRTETDEFDFFREKYSLRFYFRGWGESYNKEILIGNIKQNSKFEYIMEQNKVVLERYYTVLEYLEFKSRLKLLLKLKEIMDDKVAVLKKNDSISSKNHLGEILETEDKITDIELEIIKIENNLAALEGTIVEQNGGIGQVNFLIKDIAKVESIIAEIEKFDFDSKIENINIDYKENKMISAEASLELEKAKRKKIINFAAINYNSKDYEFPEKSISLEIGLDIPLIKDKTLSLFKKEATLIERKIEYQNIKNGYRNKLISNINAIKRLGEQYYFLKERRKKYDLSASLDKYISIEGMDPLTILKLKENIISDDMKQLIITFNIYNRYIAFIEMSGIISKDPEQNYLTNKR